MWYNDECRTYLHTVYSASYTFCTHKDECRVTLRAAHAVTQSRAPDPRTERHAHFARISICTHAHFAHGRRCVRNYEYVYTQRLCGSLQEKAVFCTQHCTRLWRLLPWPRGIKQPTLGRTYTPRRPNSTENKLLRVKNFNTTMSSQETATCTTCRKFSASWYVQLINLCTYTLSLFLYSGTAPTDI